MYFTELNTMTFQGMVLSSALWGIIADKYGRRKIVVLSAVFLAYFAMLSSFAPTFGWMLFLRFIVGVYIASMPQSVTLYAEFVPTSMRGKAILLLAFFWAFGSVFEALLAWAVMPSSLGWRYLLIFSCIPVVSFLMMCYWIPESPMYLATTGQREEVEKQLKKVY